ncbi:MAG: hypothetical protein WBB31_08785 [Saprospiraceae bacterium]
MNNSFDDQLRKKWEEKHFPVDDQHRNEMISLLETNRRKKGIFWWFGGLAIAVAIGGVLFYVNRENKIQAPVLPAPVVTEKNKSDVAQLSKAIVDKDNIQFSESKTEKSNTTRSSKSSKKVVQPTISEIKPSIDHSHAPAKNAMEKSVTQQSSTIENEQIAKTDIRQISKTDITQISKTDITQNPNTDIKQSPKVVNKEDVFSTAPNAVNNELIVIPNTSPSIVSKTVGITVIPDDVEFMPADAPEHHYTYDPVPLESIFFSEVTEQSSLTLAIKPSAAYFHSFNLFAEAGAGFIPGLKNEYSAGWNFNVGGGVGYKTGSKTSILLSAGYLLQKEGFNFERTSTVTQQGFGIRSNFNTLQPDKLHFIYSKLGLQYEVKRNIFSIYGGMQYLYGAQGTIVIRTVDQFATGTESSHYAWLSTDGMQRLLFNGEVLYGYRIAPRIVARAGLKYYFTSIDKNDDALRDEGYSWKGKFSSITPSFTVNYIFYGKR